MLAECRVASQANSVRLGARAQTPPRRRSPSGRRGGPLADQLVEGPGDPDDLVDRSTRPELIVATNRSPAMPARRVAGVSGANASPRRRVALRVGEEGDTLAIRP